MTALLLDRGLANSSLETPALNSAATPMPNNPVRQIARASTLTAVRQLDSERKGLLVRFLYESNLIGSPFVSDRIIVLDGAELSGAQLSTTGLIGADFRSTNLNDAALSGAYLYGANLNEATLIDADLSDALLGGAHMSKADLTRANLSGALVKNESLSPEDIGPYLEDANLSGADLSRAVGLDNEQLAQAATLVGATLPGGTVMTEEAWEQFKKRYRQ